MDRRAAVITVSDRGFQGEREDTSGPALCGMLQEKGWDVVRVAVVPDDKEQICRELTTCADVLRIPLVLTTGGTGFSPRDVTPEATLSVIERRTPGIPEAMRAYSMTLTPRGCLSREEAGIRGSTLIINLPGSRKASTENFAAVIDAVAHGVEMLQSSGSADCAAESESQKKNQEGIVLSVNLSEQKGTKKHPVDVIELTAGHGVQGDAHAGPWHRQVSLLGDESIDKIRKNFPGALKPGDFAENILTRGLCLYRLPVGTRLRIGMALCEVTQIGKECHSGCEIRRQTGDCVMPREGIFVRVLEGGRVTKGDRVLVI